MDVEFKSRRLKSACSSEKEGDRTWGAVRARVVRRRLAELVSAAHLGVIQKIPGPRLHPLHGNRSGEWAVDVVHPFRLVFEIAEEEIPRLDDGGVDLTRVTSIRILAVEDYHGR